MELVKIWPGRLTNKVVKLQGVPMKIRRKNPKVQIKAQPRVEAQDPARRAARHGVINSKFRKKIDRKS